MYNQVDIERLDAIIKNTIEAINNSRGQIYEIAENARKECKRLEKELREMQFQVRQVMLDVQKLEIELKKSRKILVALSKKFEDRTDEQLKDAYTRADNIRIALAVKREQEQNLIDRRNELEIRLKESQKTVQMAENLISQIGIAMGYLTNDLHAVSSQLKTMQSRQNLGIKIIKAQEDERQRVASDIHDGPAQAMSNVVLKAEICEKMINIDINKAKEELKDLKRIVRNCLQDIRRIIYDLRPMSLDDLGLIPTVQLYVSKFSNETGIKVHLRSFGTYVEEVPEISLAVFRIFQESLNNVKKHAQAKTVIINIAFGSESMILTIVDDGKGFNLEEVNKRNNGPNGGYGLHSMRERVELLGGSLDIKSELGKGTRLNIKIPLTNKEGSVDIG